MKPYEIREIDGQKVFVKEIRPMFYLVNDVFVLVPDDFSVDDDAILDFLNEKNHPVFPYDSAENGSVVVLSRGFHDGELIRSLGHFYNLSGPAWAEDARCAYDEYRSWAGI